MHDDAVCPCTLALKENACAGHIQSGWQSVMHKVVLLVDQLPTPVRTGLGSRDSAVECERRKLAVGCAEA